ncbi:phosphoglycerate kinase [Candidatus Amesbacteria bacterium]|nr:phosphoglycerate kinase [Candidatus Amesbacteria bacterium]MBI2587255.1 phosphoglycerate kinase [Candidatus Amesbacteria bacterium]
MKGQYLKGIRDVDVAGKGVLVRADLEGGPESQRVKVTKQIIEYLLDTKAGKIKVIGHEGHFEYPGIEIDNDVRKDEREKNNDESYATELAEGWDIYVNESFAESHRKYVSVNALPRLMKKQGKEVGVGLRFEKEIEMLDKIQDTGEASASRARFKIQFLVIGGAKVGDKAKYADEFEEKGWTVLRGGLLPGVNLRDDGLDISDETIERYKAQVGKAQVIVVAGPMGKYEIAERGTREVFTAVADSGAYKIAGGGDTENALAKFGLLGKFDWVSVGGGAMLEYLATGTLPGIQALIQ